LAVSKHGKHIWKWIALWVLLLLLWKTPFVPHSPLASEKGRKNGAEARGWKCQLSWACLYLCVFGRPCPVHHVKEEARRLDLDRCRNQEDGSDFTLWVCLYSCCCGRHHPPPFASSQKKGRRKNMVSKLEVGGNSIVSWLVCIRFVYLDWKTFCSWSISCKGRDRTRRDGLEDWLEGFEAVVKQRMEVKDGSPICFVSLYFCVLLWKTPFAPLLAFVSETVQDRTVQDRTTLLNRERWKCISELIALRFVCIWKTLSCSFHVKEETTWLDLEVREATYYYERLLVWVLHVFGRPSPVHLKEETDWLTWRFEAMGSRRWNWFEVIYCELVL